MHMRYTNTLWRRPALLRTLGVVLAVIVTLAACKPDGGQGLSFLPNLGSLVNGDTDQVPVFRTVSGAVVPIHVQASAAALAMRLRGATPAEVSKKLFVDGTQAVEPDPGFDYAGFALMQVKILRNADDPGEPHHHHYAGVMHFENDVGRRTAVAFEFDYMVDKDRVKVAQMLQTPVFPENPATEMYVVPIDDVAATFADAADDYDRLYKLVLDKAVPLSQTNLPADPRKYLVTVFYKDRLSPDGQVEINIGSSKAGAAGDAKGSNYHEYNGWVVAVIGAEFKLSADHALWVKALYTPGSDVAENRRGTRVVGLYSTAPGQGKGS